MNDNNYNYGNHGGQQQPQGGWNQPQQNGWNQPQWNGQPQQYPAPQPQWNYAPQPEKKKGLKVLVIVLAAVLGLLLIALAAVLLLHAGVFGGGDSEAADSAAAADTIVQAEEEPAADTGVQAEDESAADNGSDIDQTAAAQYSVGDTITFGSYGGGDIEWRVLQVDGDKLMLISVYGLELFPEESLMFADYSYDTWENCDLRTWLNGDFYDTAFTDEEKSAILTTTVENPDTYYGQDAAGNYIKNNTGDGITDLQSRAAGGNATEDKVFLLSLDEAQTLFDPTQTTLQTVSGYEYTGCADLQCAAIAAVAGGSTNDDYTTATGEGCVWWWLRSTGGNDGLNCVVGMDGICQYYYDWHYVNPVVRPVIWIEAA